MSTKCDHEWAKKEASEWVEWFSNHKSKASIVNLSACYIDLVKQHGELREALELTATPVNVVHTVHPECFCNGCQQKKVLSKLSVEDK